MAYLPLWVHGSLHWEVELAWSLVGKILARPPGVVRVYCHVGLFWLVVLVAYRSLQLSQLQGYLVVEEQMATP